jgi:hypothetical protein
MSRTTHRVTEFIWLGFAAAAVFLDWGAAYIVGALVLSAIHQVAADLLSVPSHGREGAE